MKSNNPFNNINLQTQKLKHLYKKDGFQIVKKKLKLKKKTKKLLILCYNGQKINLEYKKKLIEDKILHNMVVDINPLNICLILHYKLKNNIILVMIQK